MITTTCVDNIQPWEADSNRFDELAPVRFMNQYAWLRTWWEIFGGSRSLYLLRVNDGERVIGYLPMYREHSALRGNVLRILGSGKVCSDNVGISSERGCEEAVAESLAGFLATSEGKWAWDFIELDGVQTRNETMLQFGRHMAQRGMLFSKNPSPSCWELDVASGWESFLAGHSKRTRRLFRKSESDYLESCRAVAVYPSSANEAIEQLRFTASLHEARWSERGISGCFSSKGFGEFLELACRRLWERNELYSSVLQFDGQIAAGVIGVRQSERLSLYLVGMDHSLQEHRPGFLLNIATIQKAIELGCTTIDFLRGDEEYKGRLGAVAVEQSVWRASAPKPLSRLRESTWNAGRRVKHWVESLKSSHTDTPTSPNIGSVNEVAAAE